MKLAISLLAALAITGCTDTARAQWGAMGQPGTITCYSGGKVILETKSTGKIFSEEHSDGWVFNDAATDRLVRVSGDCVIRN